jgi:hypothetical protein
MQPYVDRRWSSVGRDTLVRPTADKAWSSPDFEHDVEGRRGGTPDVGEGGLGEQFPPAGLADLVAEGVGPVLGQGRGGASSPFQQVVHTVAHPVADAPASASRTSRVLPIPGSPLTSTSSPRPSAAPEMAVTERD